MDPANAATAAACPLGQLVADRCGRTITCACLSASLNATATSTDPPTPRTGRNEALRQLRRQARAHPTAMRSGIRSLNSCALLHELVPIGRLSARSTARSAEIPAEVRPKAAAKIANKTKRRTASSAKRRGPYLRVRSLIGTGSHALRVERRWAGHGGSPLRGHQVPGASTSKLTSTPCTRGAAARRSITRACSQNLWADGDELPTAGHQDARRRPIIFPATLPREAQRSVGSEGT
jgi:hypothetical protein